MNQRSNPYIKAVDDMLSSKSKSGISYSKSLAKYKHNSVQQELKNKKIQTNNTNLMAEKSSLNQVAQALKESGIAVSPTSPKAQSLNGSGYSQLVDNIQRVMTDIDRSPKVFAPTVLSNAVGNVADALTSFVFDMIDSDPLQAVPYFTKAMDSESKIDIPTVFDPSFFMMRNEGSRYIEKNSFTFATLPTANLAAGVVSPVAFVQYADPNAPARHVGAVIKCRRKDYLSDSLVTVRHKLLNYSYDEESEEVTTTEDVLYTQTFILREDVGMLLIPFLNRTQVMNTKLVTSAVNGNKNVTVFQNGDQYIIGDVRQMNADCYENPTAESQLPGNLSTYYASKQVGVIEIVDQANVSCSATLVRAAGNPGLALTRAIIQGSENVFFDAVVSELK